MLQIFRLEKDHLKYRYQFYQPDTVIQFFCNPPHIDVFQNCRDIRNIVSPYYIFGMPEVIDLHVSSIPLRKYRSWFLTLENDGAFSFETPGRIWGRKRASLGMFTKYLLPFAHRISLNGKPTGIWEVYIKIKIVRRRKY